MLQNTVHHVSLGQLLQLVYKVDHVVAHWRSMDAVNKTSVLQA